NSSMMTRLSADQVANEWEVHVQNQKIALQAYEDGVKTGVALNKNLVELYKTQLTLTYILTVFVLSMVVVAVAISYQQFRRDDGEDSNSTLKFGATGIEISSSVIGLFILVAAMFFFYLYIDRVYRIRPLEQFAAPSNATLLDAKR
ncbi:MAG: hypothetical protein Q7U11_22730, partial [Phenylobacterium sp.]|nr:hypothetical protein [Phenylobacterium sp.]